MRLPISLSSQMSFISIFLAIIGGSMAKETDKPHGFDGQVGRAVAKFPTIKLPQGKDVWHNLWDTGKTVALDKRAETKDVEQRDESDDFWYNLWYGAEPKDGKQRDESDEFWHTVVHGVEPAPLDKRAATKDETQNIDSETTSNLPKVKPNQRKGVWHDLLWWKRGDLASAASVDKRGAAVTKYVTQTATVTVVKTKTPGTTVHVTDTVYRTKIKTRTISVNGKAITTSDSKAVLENDGWMFQSSRYSGSVLAGLALAVVMVVYA